jgi:hypothetical protein
VLALLTGTDSTVTGKSAAAAGNEDSPRSATSP